MDRSRLDQSSRKFPVQFTVVENGILIRYNTDLQCRIYGEFENFGYKSNPVTGGQFLAAPPCTF